VYRELGVSGCWEEYQGVYWSGNAERAPDTGDVTGSDSIVVKYDAMQSWHLPLFLFLLLSR